MRSTGEEANTACIFAVGSPAEIGHHLAPLAARLAIVFAEPQAVLQRAKAGDLAIFYSEHFDRFRDACLRLRERQVATIYLVDGILEWRNAWENSPDELACPWTMRPALADKIACLGPSQARILAAWGNADKVEIVGAPRFDSLWCDAGHFRGHDADPREANVSPLAASHPVATRLPAGPNGPVKGSSRWHVMVATAKCPGFTPPQVEATFRSLCDVRDWIRANQTFAGRTLEVTWRLEEKMANRLGVATVAREYSGGELVNQLRSCDALLTTPSTTMIEGMALGLPVALLDYHLAPQLYPAVWTISAAEHLSPTFQEMMAPPAVKMWHQQWLFRDALYQGEPATVRLHRLIERMVDISREQLGTGQPLRFPPNILELSPREQTLDFCTFFPQIADISALGVSEAHRELAHARREIERLNSRLTQLQSELNEAHRIFDLIHRHPVAGPIVRLRQKWLDWWRRVGVVRVSGAEASSQAKP